MLLKRLVITVALFCACLNLQAQLRAERKALRVFSKHILRQIDRKYFFEDPADSAQVIYYDGTVANLIGVAWNARPKHKDIRGESELHGQSAPQWSAKRRYRERELRIRRRRDFKHDFDSVSIVAAGNHLHHDLRQRDSLSKLRLPIPRQLKRVPSARYQKLGTDLNHLPAGMFLTVHRALVGQHFILVELTAARSAECYKRYSNIPVIVVFRRQSLRLVAWWYIKGADLRD